MTRLEKDEKVLKKFVTVYCKHEHKQNQLCAECQDILDYSLGRLQKCPYDPKPMCKKCPVHCYKPFYRQKIKQIMKKAGILMILRGRLDYVYHYFF